MKCQFQFFGAKKYHIYGFIIDVLYDAREFKFESDTPKDINMEESIVYYLDFPEGFNVVAQLIDKKRKLYTVTITAGRETIRLEFVVQQNNPPVNRSTCCVIGGNNTSLRVIKEDLYMQIFGDTSRHTYTTYTGSKPELRYGARADGLEYNYDTTSSMIIQNYGPRHGGEHPIYFEWYRVEIDKTNAALRRALNFLPSPVLDEFVYYFPMQSVARECKQNISGLV